MAAAAPYVDRALLRIVRRFREDADAVDVYREIAQRAQLAYETARLRALLQLDQFELFTDGRGALEEPTTADGLLVTHLASIAHIALGTRVRLERIQCVFAFDTLYLRDDEADVQVVVLACESAPSALRAPPPGAQRVTILRGRVAERGVLRIDAASSLVFE